jgi:filamentous hemagglutinin family protein
VVAGSATFQSNANALTVTNANGAVINWKGFSIGQGEITRFIQPNAASQVLNRVTGGNPSLILGALQSNGRVFLINQNGIAFGPNARVDVGGLVVSSLGCRMPTLPQAGSTSPSRRAPAASSTRA